jgi:hypothetical protein
MSSIVNPTIFAGSLAPGQAVKPGDAAALSTLMFLYNVILPDSKMQTLVPGFVNVKDVAAACIAGTKVSGRNRLFLTGDWFELKDAIDYVASVRPELKGRLPSPTPTGQKESIVSNERAEEILGIKVRPWKETVLENVDFFVKLEKDWESQGVDLDATIRNTVWKQ